MSSEASKRAYLAAKASAAASAAAATASAATAAKAKAAAKAKLKADFAARHSAAAAAAPEPQLRLSKESISSVEAIAAQRMALLASFPPGTFSKPNFDELVPFDQYQALNDISSWVALSLGQQRSIVVLFDLYSDRVGLAGGPTGECMRSLLKDGYRILCDDLFGIRGAQRTPLLTKRAFEEVYTQHAKERPPQCEPPAFTKETHAEETAQHVDVVGFVSILTSIAQSWRRTVGQPLGPLGLAALLSQIVASGEQTWGWEARLAERQINRVRTPWTGRPKLNIWDMLLEDEEEEGGRAPAAIPVKAATKKKTKTVQLPPSPAPADTADPPAAMVRAKSAEEEVVENVVSQAAAMCASPAPVTEALLKVGQPARKGSGDEGSSDGPADEMIKLRDDLLQQSRKEMRAMRDQLLDELKPAQAELVRNAVHHELKQERLLSAAASPAVATALKKQMNREVGGMTPRTERESLVIGTAVPSWVVETPLSRGARQKASPYFAKTSTTPGSAGWQLHLMRGENARAVVSRTKRP